MLFKCQGTIEGPCHRRGLVDRSSMRPRRTRCDWCAKEHHRLMQTKKYMHRAARPLISPSEVEAVKVAKAVKEEPVGPKAALRLIQGMMRAAT